MSAKGFSSARPLTLNIFIGDIRASGDGLDSLDFESQSV